MIRGRACSHGTEGSGIFRELWHPSDISYRLGLNTESLFVLKVWLNISWPIGQHLKGSFLLMFSFSFPSVIITFQNKGLVRVTVLFFFTCWYCTEGRVQPSWLHHHWGLSQGQISQRGKGQTEDHLLHVDDSEQVLFDLASFIVIY